MGSVDNLNSPLEEVRLIGREHILLVPELLLLHDKLVSEVVLVSELRGQLRLVGCLQGLLQGLL